MTTADTSYVLPVIISLIGVILSIVVSSFIAGSRYGMMVQTLSSINERLTRIETLFELKLKDKLCSLSRSPGSLTPAVRV
jgi:hypothetical protein